jgi:hypothetical protein
MAGDAHIDKDSAGLRRGDPKPMRAATPGQRLILGIWLLALLLLEANAAFGWGLLGAYGRAASIIVLIIGLLLLFRILASLRRAD